MWYLDWAAPAGYKSEPRVDLICTHSAPANSRRLIQYMLAVMPDPNGDSNSDGCSNNQRCNNPWPFERKLGDTKVFPSRLLVPTSFRQ